MARNSKMQEYDTKKSEHKESLLEEKQLDDSSSSQSEEKKEVLDIIDGTRDENIQEEPDEAKLTQDNNENGKNGSNILSTEPSVHENKVNESVCSEIYETASHICFAVKVRGLSHIKNGSNCQDAFCCKKVSINGKDIIIVGVADGHGHKNHFLSEHGAQFAVECICKIFESYGDKYNNIDDLYATVQNDFPFELYQAWCESVEIDYAERYPEERSENKIEIHEKYGTTAMFCLVIENEFIFGKLDGNITFYKKNDYFEPIKDDDELMGAEAYSLCAKEHALNKWSFDRLRDADFLILSTDGLRNSFGVDKNPVHFYNAISVIYEYICKYGEPVARDALPEFLSRCTNRGSGDDLTVCCIRTNSSEKMST